MKEGDKYHFKMEILAAVRVMNKWQGVSVAPELVLEFSSEFISHVCYLDVEICRGFSESRQLVPDSERFSTVPIRNVGNWDEIYAELTKIGRQYYCSETEIIG